MRGCRRGGGGGLTEGEQPRGLKVGALQQAAGVLARLLFRLQVGMLLVQRREVQVAALPGGPRQRELPRNK